MENDISNDAPQTAKSIVETTEKPASEKRRYPWLAVISLLLCIGAWIAATKNGFVTLAIGAAAIIAGAFSLGSRRAAVRNTAITSIIATAVLIIVVGAFIFALHKLLN